jgi:hypothetical protein
MANTIRRKHANATHEKLDWLVRKNWVGHILTDKVRPGHPQYARLSAKFHGDAYRSMRNAPAGFRRDIERSKRSRDRDKLLRYLRNEDTESLILDKRHKDAAWNWW